MSVTNEIPQILEDNEEYATTIGGVDMGHWTPKDMREFKKATKKKNSPKALKMLRSYGMDSCSDRACYGEVRMFHDGYEYTFDGKNMVLEGEE